MKEKLNHNSKLYFRMARKEEIPQIIKLFTDSFCEDPLMTLFNPSGKNQLQFIYELFAVVTRGYFHQHLCFVATIEGEIVAAALVKKKNVPELNFISYARFGGVGLIKSIGIKKFIQFLSTYDKVLADCKAMDPDAWYLESIAVSKNCQGKGIGGSMLQDCIMPYIRENEGGLFTLVTQNKNNCKFYIRNGFTHFATSLLENGTCKIPSFSYQQEMTSL